MKKTIILSLAAMAIFAFVSCNRVKTTYRIEYRFDNTDLHSDMIKVFECTDGSANGKWRGEFNKYDTVMVDGEPHQFAYGVLKDVAREGVNELYVYTSNTATFEDHQLDSIFRVVPDVENVFVITPEMTWHRDK